MKKHKLTKQGVRDLNSLPTPKRENVSALLQTMYCEHKRMQPCCPDPRNPKKSLGCGHLNCPDCGLFWDHYYETL